MTVSFYTLKELAQAIHKSPGLLYRRLVEDPPRYQVRHARRQGGTWLFPREAVDDSLRRGEPILFRPPEQSVSVAVTRAIGYFKRGSKAGGKG